MRVRSFLDVCLMHPNLMVAGADQALEVACTIQFIKQLNNH